jgi:hypothetical protein
MKSDTSSLAEIKRFTVAACILSGGLSLRGEPRVTEWQVEWLRGRKGTVENIPKFLEKI